MLSMSINGIDFIDINSYLDENSNSIFQQDKIHFNEHGHLFLFNKIFKKIKVMNLPCI